MRELALAEIEGVSGGEVTTRTEPLPGGGTRVIGTVTSNDPFATSISSDDMLMSGAGSWGEYLDPNSGLEAQLVHGNDSSLGHVNDLYPELQLSDEEAAAINADDDPSTWIAHDTAHCANDSDLAFTAAAGALASTGHPVGALGGAVIAAAGALIPDGDHCRYEDAVR